MSGRKVKHKGIKLFIAFLLFLILVGNLFSAYIVMIRTVRSVAQSQMEDVANRAIHTAIARASEKVIYDELVTVHRNDEGNIETISLNAVAANKLKSDIGLGVLDYLNKPNNYIIEVPIGNFFGTEFLSGVGPGIKFKIVPCNIAHIDFESKFKPAGINQVLHTLSVRVDVDISALLPGFQEISNLSSSAVVTETVIMGDVPETYLNIQK